MQALNLWVGTGRVGFIEAKNENNRQFTVASLYLSDDYKDSNGDWVDRDNNIRVTFWYKGAENLPNFIQKGDEVYVIGKLVSAKGTDDKTVLYVNGTQLTKLSPGKASTAATQTTAAPKTNKATKSNWSKGKTVSPPDDEEIDLDDLFESSTV